MLNQKGKNKSAVECYRQALKINTKNLPSIFNLACNLEKLEDYQESKQCFERAIAVDPEWVDALYGLTLVCIKLNLAVEAIKHIKDAVRIKGDQSAPHVKYALALAYRANLDYEKANQAYVPIMKDETTILAYKEIVNKNNKVTHEYDHGGSHVIDVDLYSHFIE